MTCEQLQRSQTLADVAEIARQNSSTFPLALDEFVDEFYLDHLAIASGFDNPDLLPISALGAWEQARALIRIDKVKEKGLPIPWKLKHLIDKPRGAKKLALATLACRGAITQFVRSTRHVRPRLASSLRSSGLPGAQTGRDEQKALNASPRRAARLVHVNSDIEYAHGHKRPWSRSGTMLDFLL